MQIIAQLRQLAAQQPAVIAITSAAGSMTYAQLMQSVDQEAQRLVVSGEAARGRIYQLIASQDADYLVRFLALHEVGAICAPVDAPIELPAYCNPEVSDILFTTGSTSQPKGVLLSEEAILADADNLITAHGYRAGLTFVICGPIHHFGCWSKVLPTLLTGGTLCILEGLKDQEALFAALGSASRTATFLVPSAIRMLLQFGREQLMALRHHIDFIETGAAPITTADMEQLRELLPYTRLYNTYASTETGVVCTYPFHLPTAEDPEADNATAPSCLAGCAGPTMKHAHVRLDDEGHIIVSGRMIMSGYLHNPVAPTEVITSDIGRFTPDGYLLIIGRDSDFINVGGLKVAPAEVEDAVLEMPSIADCICLPKSHPVMGQVPRLLVVMRPGIPFDRRPIIQHLKARLESFKVPLAYEEVTEIRKTFNGKKDRKSYRD